MSLRRSKLAHQRKCELALVEACQLGDCIKVRKLLEQGVSANSVGTFGWTALHEAANGGHTAIVCLLRSCDCELDFVGTAGETALHKCAANNDVKTMDVLLSSGCGVDVRNSGGHSPLHVTAYHNHLEAAQLLLCYNADVLERDRWNQTPLHRAAGKKNVCILERFNISSNILSRIAHDIYVEESSIWNLLHAHTGLLNDAKATIYPTGYTHNICCTSPPPHCPSGGDLGGFVKPVN